jgi:hypothetical protein
MGDDAAEGSPAAAEAAGTAALVAAVAATVAAAAAGSSAPAAAAACFAGCLPPQNSFLFPNLYKTLAFSDNEVANQSAR